MTAQLILVPGGLVFNLQRRYQKCGLATDRAVRSQAFVGSEERKRITHTDVRTQGLGSIRIQCFRELGQLFTFDLSILPDHKLVTFGCYGYVRHPSYTGSMLIVSGLAFSHLTAGSLAVECSVLGPIGSLLLCVAWWMWTLSVGVSRAIAEDKELQKSFGPEWDAYAATTKFWFVPGLF